MTDPRENMRHITLDCAQSVFAPCPDPDCVRPCGKRPDPSVVIAPNRLESILYGVAVSLMALSVLAGVGAIAEQGIENNRAVIAANMEP